MEKRQLGNSQLYAAPLALGGNVFGWTVTEPTSFKILDGFTNAGLNLIDTADVYCRWVTGNHGGESETIIGRWLKQSNKRDQVIIATKVGMEFAPGRKGLSKSHILRSAEESLKRLQIDHIDLYQAHEDDPNTPLEETLSAFAQLIKEGKVRAIGTSNYSGSRLAHALHVSQQNGLPRYESLQPLYNLYDREEFERALKSVCLKNKIGVINYYSLACGFLTGKYRSDKDRSKSPRGAKAASYLNERGLRILKALDEASQRLNSTPARVALAWLIARPGVTAPIASATSLEQLHDLIEATRLKLDPDSLKQLDGASAWTT